jgi:hypothetical protein
LTQRFSVITPSLNQGRYIKQTIESVLKQKYPNFEHLIADGGSSDETLSILKSYSHLRWNSAPDGGQADALNKLLSASDGDIVAWINADDWYGDDVFSEVAEQLLSAPIVVGQCVITDEYGLEKYRPPLAPRTWFDMLKYWVPYSIPPQPAIFFRREILESVRRADGTFLDPSLNLVMDWDLWLRLAEQNAFTYISKKVFAYYRMSEGNKTSESRDWQSENHQEISRVFRTAEERRYGNDHKKLYTSEAGQIVFQEYLNDSSRISSSSLVFLGDLSVPDEDLRLEQSAFLESDDCGIVIFNSLSEISLPIGDLDIRSLFSGVSFTGAYVRRAALEDCGKLPNTRLLQYFIRHLSLCLLAKCWRVKASESFNSTCFSPQSVTDKQEALYSNYTNAQILIDAADLVKHDPFSWVPRSEGMGIEFPEDLIRECRNFLSGAPPNWYSLEFSGNLEQTIQSYPNFAPALRLLSLKLADAGSLRSSEFEYRAEISYAKELVIKY